MMTKFVLHFMVGAGIFFANILLAQSEEVSSKKSDDRIIKKIQQYQPLLGARISNNIKDEIGATHVAGKYFFSSDPYLIEGGKKLLELGYGIIKVWFRKNPGNGYYYNSNWQLKSPITLKELAQHPYWDSLFNMPFSTFALSVDGAGIKTNDVSAQKEEEEIYELTKYLLDKFKHRKVTFIIHNWEGDWMLRGGTGDYARWSRKPGELIKAVDGDRYTVLVPSDSMTRINAMAQWFTARQNGVNRARNEVKNSLCKVYHAVEANKVLDSKAGIPGIVNSVLPLVETDMVSWSCYDGMDASGIGLYKGIQYIKSNMQPTPYMKNKKVVFLGEIGIPEQRYDDLKDRNEIVKRWDAYIGVCRSLKVPYMIQWELYCNEPKDENLRKLTDVRITSEMRGFWLIRPDGTLSYVGEYFNRLLQNAGRKLL